MWYPKCRLISTIDNKGALIHRRYSRLVTLVVVLHKFSHDGSTVFSFTSLQLKLSLVMNGCLVNGSLQLLTNCAFCKIASLSGHNMRAWQVPGKQKCAIGNMLGFMNYLKSRYKAWYKLTSLFFKLFRCSSPMPVILLLGSSNNSSRKYTIPSFRTAWFLSGSMCEMIFLQNRSG